LVSRLVVTAAIIVVIIIGGVVLFLGPLAGQTSSSATSSPSSRGSSSTTGSATSALNNYRFLIFNQKGIVELASPDGALLGYSRLYNISLTSPVQTYYWESYPVQGAPRGNFLVPLNNGTVEVVDGSKMVVQQRFSVGNATGFIGVAVSSDEQYAAIADGPSGIVEVVKLSTLQTVWKTVFNRPSGVTAYPCDVRWAPDGSTLVIPMKNNGTVDVVTATTGSMVSSASLPVSAQPFMLSINSQGNMLGVELSGNKTEVFYSYPSLKPLATTSFPAPNFSPDRGLFTQDGKYFLEASGATNVIEVVSVADFTVVNTIILPSSGAPGLADMELTPDGANAYVVMHGTPATGGIIYIIPLANIATVSAASASIALTTAPSFALPISMDYATYLANNVLSPPTTGLHC